jgi:tRNA1(Val) A37 N6-methylase TrmN6
MCGEVIEGVDFGKAAGVDGAHEKIADICAGLGLIGQRNLKKF